MAHDGLPADVRELRPSIIGYDRATNVFRVVFGWPDSRNEWFKLHFENVYLDGTTGQVVARFGNSSAVSAGDKFSALLFPLHSGQIFGLPGRVLICITGLSIDLLVITGVQYGCAGDGPARKKRGRHQIERRVQSNTTGVVILGLPVFRFTLRAKSLNHSRISLNRHVSPRRVTISGVVSVQQLRRPFVSRFNKLGLNFLPALVLARIGELHLLLERPQASLSL